MSYDGLDRLLTAQSAMFGGDGVARYSYDALDNLRTVQMGGSQRRYHYDGSNRLTNVIDQASQATVIGLGYDVQGNLNRRNGASYEFDYGNRLRKAMPVAGAEESYRYDAYGRRAQARAGNGVIHSHYSQGGQLAYQQDARRGMRVDYLYLGGSLLAQRERPLGSEAETVRYHHTDALGSPVVVTDANQAVVERSEYAPYGQLLNRPMVDGPGYAGHVMDTMTGLVQMQQRYYDPTIGRMLSVDPVSADPNTGALFNRYMYAANNPYRFFDPDGRCTGSRIENDDGTCKSTGGFTTQSTSATAGRSGSGRPTQWMQSGDWQRNVSEPLSREWSPFRAAWDASTEAGDAAAQSWADAHVKTGNWLYAVPGGFASLWTPKTAPATSVVLSAGASLGAWSARPFWQYYPAGNTAYNSTWMTRGWGWRPPYATGAEARNALALPPWNSATGVRPVSPTGFVWGPRSVAPQPQWGHAAPWGVEYRTVPFGD
ncbi:RHS repeat domain-containing protein [Pseudomonas sp. Hp2]|uniref:RHS repeat domain-containing protein n=1 Tax=Pseudomonas sp. Hp2 TaxID=701189 RepID=UPI001C49C3B5|nr:RHS repeat-associated core domain-containing protein [Pseudomonas sp. Hp2]